MKKKMTPDTIIQKLLNHLALDSTGMLQASFDEVSDMQNILTALADRWDAIDQFAKETSNPKLLGLTREGLEVEVSEEPPTVSANLRFDEACEPVGAPQGESSERGFIDPDEDPLYE